MDDKLVRLSDVLKVMHDIEKPFTDPQIVFFNYRQRDAIGNIPAVDAVEVVRCRECRYFAVATANDVDLEVHGCYLLKKLGEKYPLLAQGEGFCSWGQRREDGDKDV